MTNYRSGYLQQGSPQPRASKEILLIADDMVLSPNDATLVVVKSDNATATNRTFTILNGQLKGQALQLSFASASSYTCDLQSAGNVKLSGAWQPLQYDTLDLMWDGAAYWVEVGRGNTGSGGVTNIADGVIVNADINASAAIAFSKLATLSSTNILVGSSGNVAASVAMTGDVTIGNTGVTAIGANKVTVGMQGAAVMIEVTGTLTSAQILALSAPVELIPAGGAGTVLIVDEIELLHTYSTAAYATGSDVAIEYATSGANIALVVDSFVTAGASANAIIKPSTYDLDGSTGTGAGFDVTANSNKAVQVTSSDFTDGNAANIIKYRIRYHTVTLLT